LGPGGVACQEHGTTCSPVPAALLRHIARPCCFIPAGQKPLPGCSSGKRKLSTKYRNCWAPPITAAVAEAGVAAATARLAAGVAEAIGAGGLALGMADATGAALLGAVDAGRVVGWGAGAADAGRVAGVVAEALPADSGGSAALCEVCDPPGPVARAMVTTMIPPANSVRVAVIALR
jgi:hypothetical protein